MEGYIEPNDLISRLSRRVEQTIEKSHVVGSLTFNVQTKNF